MHFPSRSMVSWHDQSGPAIPSMQQALGAPLIQTLQTVHCTIHCRPAPARGHAISVRKAKLAPHYLWKTAQLRATVAVPGPHRAWGAQ